MNEQLSAQLSALMDGELDEADAANVMAHLRIDADRRGCWSDYHLIGDALRGSTALDRDLTASVMEALIDEPVVLAPPRRLSRQGALQRSLAMAASAAGVAVVSALAWSSRPAAEAQQIAMANVSGVPGVPGVPIAAQVPPQLANADLLAYLVAHQAQAPSAQGAAHYIKTVSMEAGGR